MRPHLAESHGSRPNKSMRSKYTVAIVFAATLICFASTSFAVGMANAASQNLGIRWSGQSRSLGGNTASEYSSSDFNRKIFYKNKFELSLETGALAYNTPLILDPIFGQTFKRQAGLPYYTLVPTSLMVGWQLYNPRGPWFLRGTTEFSFGGVYTAIVKGPESIFTGPIIGLRYFFVQPNTRMVPFAYLRGGLGYTDAQGPYEVAHHQPDIGQGQDLTFTFSMGSGLRYDFNARYSAYVSVDFMHISNAYLSEPKYYNHGVNVVGGLVGFTIELNNLFSKV